MSRSTPFSPARSGQARTVLLFVVILALGAGAVVFLRTSDHPIERNSTGITRTAADVAAAAESGEVTTALGSPTVGEDTTGREVGGEDPPTAPDDVANAEVAAVDAVSGEPIRLFWVEVDAFTDRTGASPRRVSDPATGVASVPLGGASAFVDVRAPAFAGASAEVRAGRRTTVRLERATCLVGRVVDGSSAPLDSARVTLEYLGSLQGASPDLDEAGQPRAIPFPDSYQGATLRRTDEDGRFTFHRLPPGVYRTRVVADGATQVSAPARVHAGGWTTSDHWMDEFIRLVVAVETATGEPAAASRVSLHVGGSDEPIVARYTDESGRVTIGPIDPGTYQLRVLSDDGSLEHQPVEIPDDGRSIRDVHLVLLPPER